MDQNQSQPLGETPETTQQPNPSMELLARLERVVRASNKDSMEVARGQRELQQSMRDLNTRVDEFELQVKGLTQETWRTAKESQTLSQNATEHFAGALRDLEKRIREDMQWEFNRSTALAIFPALNDLDLIIDQQHLLNGDDDDPLLEAVELVREKFDQALQKMGWQEIDIKIGVTKFDPEKHEGVVPQDGFSMDDFDVPPGTIVKIHRRGYYRGNHILRSAQVIVKK
jgi:molecular chaperone GrpE (heat shock protein)